MIQWDFTWYVCECVCGAGSGGGGGDGGLRKLHHHGDCGIIVLGGRWCWSEYSIGSRKEQHGNNKIHWATGQMLLKCPSLSFAANFIVYLHMVLPLIHWSAEPQDPCSHPDYLLCTEKGNGCERQSAQAKWNCCWSCWNDPPFLPPWRGECPLGRRDDLTFWVCQKLQINWTHWSLRRLFVL